MNTGALRSPWNVIGGARRRENLVDDVDYSVAGEDIGDRDVSIVNHDTGSYGEGQRLTVCCISHQTIGDG